MRRSIVLIKILFSLSLILIVSNVNADELGSKSKPISLDYKDYKFFTISGNKSADIDFVYSETGSQDVDVDYINDVYDNTGNITGSLLLFTSEKITPSGPFINDTKLYVFQNSVTNDLIYVTVDYSSLPSIEDPEIYSLKSEIEGYKKNISNLTKWNNSLYNQTVKLNKTIGKLEKNITNLKQDISYYEGKETEFENQIDTLESKNTDLTKTYDSLKYYYNVLLILSGVTTCFLIVFIYLYIHKKADFNLRKKQLNIQDDFDDLLTDMGSK
jgi:hypothetical protein